MPDDLPIDERFAVPGQALRVTHSRAGGPGGQNVNTRATRVQLFLDLARCGLHHSVVDRLVEAHPGKLTQSGELLVSCASSRSQDSNLQEARGRLADMIRSALTPPRKRKATRPSRSSKERRLKAKKGRGEVKRGRGKVDW